MGESLVARLRHQARLSQERLAELSGLSVRSIRGIENGAIARPRLHSLRAIGGALALDEREQATLEDYFGYPGHGALSIDTRPAELPRDIPHFVGRTTELADIVSSLTRGAGASVSAPVLTICGRGGTGKSTLAIHAAHQLAEQFPDGQLYVSLGGPLGVGPSPSDALADLLISLGIRRNQVPVNHEARVRAFRSLTSHGCYLVVLDNATGGEQLDDLLPAGPGNATIVTARRSLPEIAPLRTIVLGGQSPTEAVELLIHAAGANTHSDEEWDQLAARCGYLPLALRIAGSRLAARPDWGPGHLLERLNSSKSLSELRYRSLSVADTIAVDFQALPGVIQPSGIDPAQAVLRLAHIPSDDFTAELAAEVLRCSVKDVDDVLGELIERQFLAVNVDRRYQFHALVREFACEWSSSEPSGRLRASTVNADVLNAVGGFLDRHLQAAAELGFLQQPPSDEAQRSDQRSPVPDPDFIRIWLSQEFPLMRDYVVAAALSSDSDFDVVFRVCKWAVELCGRSSDDAAYFTVTNALSVGAERRHRGADHAWAQSHLAFQSGSALTPPPGVAEDDIED